MPVTVDLIVDALASLGGRAHIKDIEARVREISLPPMPKDVGAVIRARLQERCAEAGSYKGGVNLFRSVHGVSARQGIWELRDDQLSVAEPDAVLDGADAFIEKAEGRAELRIHLRRERSRTLVQKFKERLASLDCCVCGFSFEKTYGEHGRGYIEAHHIVPVAKLDEGGTTKISDLIAVCANCHRMLHRDGLTDWRSLKEMLRS